VIVISTWLCVSAQKERIEYIRCVDCKAEELDRQGYDVKVDVEG
jgi:hypothetical protein